MTRRVPVVLALACALLLPVAATAATDSPAPSPTAIAVPVVGPPAGTGPVGPEWRMVAQRPLGATEVGVVRCEAGFTAYASGRDHTSRSVPKGTLRALVWHSPDGVTWSRGAEITPRPSAGGTWSGVLGLIRFGERLYAVGGEGQALAVWTSDDCGATWDRIPDRSFALGQESAGLDVLELAATDDRLMVLGFQGGEEIPHRQWAWTMDRDGTWAAIPGGLDGIVDDVLTADATAFHGLRMVAPHDTSSGTIAMTSTDGRTWAPGVTIPDPDGWDARITGDGRWLTLTEPDAGTTKTSVISRSDDLASWTPIAQTASLPSDARSRLDVADGIAAWSVRPGSTDARPDGWIATSEDAGDTWEVSAGWPGLVLGGAESVAANDRSIALIGSGPDFDRVRILVRDR
ncbi:MAG: sialidase family protein [Chloroflexota bacterium]